MKLLPEISGSVSFLAWRCVWLSLVILAAAFGLLVLELTTDFLPPVLAQNLVGFLGLAAWFLAIGFVLADTWGKWLWVVTLVFATALAAFLPWPAGVWIASPISIFILTFRHYKPWRAVPDRRRAVGFGLGVLAMAVVIFIMPRFVSLADPEGAGRALKQLGAWSFISLGCFWFWSLFHLAIHMRLHFMRLRPKLGVAAVLIGLIPLLLMGVLGLMILYTGLGGARAARTTATLENWRQMTGSGVNFGSALFDTAFVWPGTETARGDMEVIEAPSWVPAMAEKMRGSIADAARLADVPADSGRATVSSATDSTNYFLAGHALWLMNWRDLDTENPSVRAWKMNEKPLKELSGILKVGIDVSPTSSSLNDDGDLVISAGGDEDRKDFPGLEVIYRDVSEDKEYWSRFYFFGATLFEVNRFDGEQIDSKTLFINLRVGWQDLKAEFLEGDSNLNIAVVIALGVLVFTLPGPGNLRLLLRRAHQPRASCRRGARPAPRHAPGGRRRPGYGHRHPQRGRVRRPGRQLQRDDHGRQTGPGRSPWPTSA